MKNASPRRKTDSYNMADEFKASNTLRVLPALGILIRYALNIDN